MNKFDKATWKNFKRYMIINFAQILFKVSFILFVIWVSVRVLIYYGIIGG